MQSWQAQPHLLLLHWFEDFDDAPVLIDHIDALKDLAVLAPPNLADHLIVVLLPAEAKQAGIGGQQVPAIYSLDVG